MHRSGVNKTYETRCWKYNIIMFFNGENLFRVAKTLEMVPKKIKAVKDNKSHGVDGIQPKLLMERVEQISIPLARVFNAKEGVVPFEWKEANIIPLF